MNERRWIKRVLFCCCCDRPAIDEDSLSRTGKVGEMGNISQTSPKASGFSLKTVQPHHGRQSSPTWRGSVCELARLA